MHAPETGILMLAKSLYYAVKPLLPRPLRIELRRLRARMIRAVAGGTWPVLETAGRTPEGWPGWPGGKQFAVALTHDVEGSGGLARCPQLVALEARLGFRSAVFFVPEGEYRVPRELRDQLVASGFEVGVHDLRHDGKLYQTRKAFRRNAQRINHYLKEWNAVGFRSGFMHHNLDWLRELDVLYDASTFDTDPFEPQPDGASTIFPFRVADLDGRGYVELPYTLVQDFTLFVVLGEPSINIWKQKLEWIADRGGLALLDVHPDYMAFGDSRPRRHEYRAALYQEFLEWLKCQYKGRYWHALPRDIAAFYNQAVSRDVTRLCPESPACGGREGSARGAPTGRSPKQGTQG